MGNVHSFAHRLTALSMACLASAGLIFCALGGFSCSFVQVQAKPERTVMTYTGEEFDTQIAFLGVQCQDTPFYDEGDKLWNLSQLFFFISLAFGGITTLMAWALSCCIPPTERRWQAMSILAAVTAVMEVPIFLIFESDNCNFDVNRQTCKMAMGAYMNVLSVFIWVVMTIWSQCLNPPMWAEELEAWKVDSGSVRGSGVDSEKAGCPRSLYSADSGGTAEEEDSPPFRDPNGAPPENEVENGHEILWPSTQQSQDIEIGGENVDKEQSGRNASLIERWLARSRNAKAKKSAKKDVNQPPQSQSAACAIPSIAHDPITVQDDSHDPHDTIMEGAMAACSRVQISASDQASQNAVCAGNPFPSNFHGNGPGNTFKYETSDCADDFCCPEAGFSINCLCPQLPPEDTQFSSRSGIPGNNNPNRKGIRAAPGIPGHADMESNRPRHERASNDDDEDQEEHNDIDFYSDSNQFRNGTGDVDFLTKRMQTEQAAAAAQSNVAPIQTIEIDTKFVREAEIDTSDEVSEMTRGSGLASGVSEVLDSNRLVDNSDPLTILEDLARSY